jgi:multidrug efflux pump subunit AcrA (membrane-fusion protein)
VRTEGAIDSDSQQLYIVAQIDNPYNKSNENVAPIKIGQYVNAEIVGKTIEQALVIPNSAIYQGSYVYVVEQVKGRSLLKRKEITIRWQNSQEAIIESGLSFNEQLVLTPLGQVSSGTPVKTLDEVSKSMKERPANKKRKGAKGNDKPPRDKRLGNKTPRDKLTSDKGANS